MSSNILNITEKLQLMKTFKNTSFTVTSQLLALISTILVRFD